MRELELLLLLISSDTPRIDIEGSNVDQIKQHSRREDFNRFSNKSEV